MYKVIMADIKISDISDLLIGKPYLRTGRFFQVRVINWFITHRVAYLKLSGLMDFPSERTFIVLL